MVNLASQEGPPPGCFQVAPTTSELQRPVIAGDELRDRDIFIIFYRTGGMGWNVATVWMVRGDLNITRREREREREGEIESVCLCERRGRGREKT